MTVKTIKLRQSAGSPNSRRVRIFLAEKGLAIPLVPVDLGKGEQHLYERLEQVPFVAGERYSAADITTLVKMDFAKALELSVPADQTALKRWYEAVSSRPSAAA